MISRRWGDGTLLEAERDGESYVIHGLPRVSEHGVFTHWPSTLNFRQLQALVAAREGLVRARLRRRQTAYYLDYHMTPECSVFGVGDGSLWDLQRCNLLPYALREGELYPTTLGLAVLDAVLALAGTRVLAVAA